MPAGITVAGGPGRVKEPDESVSQTATATVAQWIWWRRHRLWNTVLRLGAYLKLEVPGEGLQVAGEDEVDERIAQPARAVRGVLLLQYLLQRRFRWQHQRRSRHEELSDPHEQVPVVVLLLARLLAAAARELYRRLHCQHADLSTRRAGHTASCSPTAPSCRDFALGEGCYSMPGHAGMAAKVAPARRCCGLVMRQALRSRHGAETGSAPGARPQVPASGAPPSARGRCRHRGPASH